jgi:Ca2+-binding RTX toxin-like protein
VFRAAPGEVNDVLAEDGEYRQDGLWTSITDAGAPLSIREPCVDGEPVSCPSRIILYLGNRDDRGRTRSLLFTNFIYGEGGNDTIHTDGETAYAYGGPGNDQVGVSAHVGYAFGGTGDDRLTGSAGVYNRLHGDAGDDVLIQGDWAPCAQIYGDGGADTLLGRPSGCSGPVRPTQTGGTGPDALIVSSQAGHDGPWLLDGGDGADYIVGGGAGDEITAGAGADFVNAAVDGVADTVACGSGRDTVRADRLDSVAADCERVTIVG